MPSPLRDAIKALTFDIFGTVVDWRTTIIQEGQIWQRDIAKPVDWEAFADRWRDGYRPAMDRVRSGELPWMHIDAIHRMILDELLVAFGIEGLTRYVRKKALLENDSGQALLPATSIFAKSA